MRTIHRFPDLSRFTTLRKLIIENSDFPDLPEYLANLPLLEDIQIDGCQGFEIPQELLDICDTCNSEDVYIPPDDMGNVPIPRKEMLRIREKLQAAPPIPTFIGFDLREGTCF